MSERGAGLRYRISVMRLPRLSLVLTAIVGFLLGACFCAFGPRLLHAVLPSVDAHESEQTRVTSPDGQFDAVMTLTMFDGAIGGLGWDLFIVRKGKAVPFGSNPIFTASKLSRDKLVWKQTHLLDIQYEVAEIDRFRNVWCSAEIEDVGSYGERDYCVEVKLAPTAEDFSALTPEGGFQQSH